MSDQWFLRTFNQELGPVSFETLIELAHSGQLSSDDVVRLGASGPWRKAGSIARLFPPQESSESAAAWPKKSPAAAETSENARSASPARYSTVPPVAPRQPDGSASPAEAQGSARWYVRIDGTKFGPIGYEELEALLRPPRLCRTCEVRHGERGSWVGVGFDQELSEVASIRRHASVSKAILPAERRNTALLADRRSLAARRPRFEFTAKVESLLKTMWDHRLLFAFVTLWVSLNVGVFMATGRAYATDRQYLDTYTSIWSELHQLRDQEATDAQWAEFEKRANSRLDAIIAVLEKSANRDRPVKRHLLWAGRDYLRPIVHSRAAGDASRYSEEQFKRHLEAARQQIVPYD